MQRQNIVRFVVCAGVAALGASLLAGAAQSTPAAQAAGSWAGPYQMPRTSGLEANVQILPVGQRLHLVQPALNPGAAQYSRLTATPLTGGKPGELASTRDLEGLAATRRELAFASSPQGITAAITYREGYATIEFDGSRWGVPTTQVALDDYRDVYFTLDGHSVAQDASGNATYAWVQTVGDTSFSQRRTHSFYVRQRIAGQWQEPQRLYQAVSGVDAPSDEAPDVSGPAVTTLATGELLACSPWTDPVYKQPRELSRLRCWTSPGPGKAWTALPPSSYPGGNYSGNYYAVAILRDGSPMIVHFFMEGPLYTQFKGGAWSTLTRLAPLPSTPIPQPTLRFFSGFTLKTDGQGNVLMATLLAERGQTKAGYQDEQITVLAADHRGDGWSAWRKLSPTYGGLFSLLATEVGVALAPQSAVVTWIKKTEYEPVPGGLYANEFAGGAWSGPKQVSGIAPSQMGYQVFAGITANNDAALAWDGTVDSNPFNSTMRLFGSRITPVDNTLSAPRGLAAKATKGEVRLSWKPPKSGATRVTAYEWTVSVKGTDRWSKWKTVSNGAKARSVIAKGMKRGVNYVFEVRATAGKLTGPAARVEARGQ